jgi:pimeloyl-ACP methyl ester carboxylesterase
MIELNLSGIGLEYLDVGAGRPLFFVHDELGLVPSADFLRLLSADRRVIAIALPGFGRSELPNWIDTVDDLSYICLELMDHLALDRVDLVGCSFGGWVAAEMATKAPTRFNRIVLCAPFGVKIGASDRLDIPDLFTTSPDALAALSYHDPAVGAVDAAALSDADATAMVRNRETLALLSWEPYLHNPKLRHRLHRVAAPTLLLRGKSDGLVSHDYLAGFAALLPHADLAEIERAGHFPHREQPEAFTAKTLEFLND